jgi:hypothetical protein
MGNSVSCGNVCRSRNDAMVDKTPIDVSPSDFEGYNNGGGKSFRR